MCFLQTNLHVLLCHPYFLSGPALQSLPVKKASKRETKKQAVVYT